MADDVDCRENGHRVKHMREDQARIVSARRRKGRRAASATGNAVAAGMVENGLKITALVLTVWSPAQADAGRN